MGAAGEGSTIGIGIEDAEISSVGTAVPRSFLKRLRGMLICVEV